MLYYVSLVSYEEYSPVLLDGPACDGDLPFSELCNQIIKKKVKELLGDPKFKDEGIGMRDAMSLLIEELEQMGYKKIHPEEKTLWEYFEDEKCCGDIFQEVIVHNKKAKEKFYADLERENEERKKEEEK